MSLTKRVSFSLEKKYDVLHHCEERLNIRFYEVQTYVSIHFHHIISKSTAHRLMAIKEIDFEGFNPNVEVKRCVNNPEVGKELMEFVLERESDGLSEDLVLEKADILRVRHYILDHDFKL